MTDDEILGAFYYGLTLLHVDNHALTDDLNRPEDMSVMWWLCKQLHSRLARDTPYDLCLHQLVTLTAALIAGRALGIRRENLGKEWLLSRCDVLELKIASGVIS